MAYLRLIARITMSKYFDGSQTDRQTYCGIALFSKLRTLIFLLVASLNDDSDCNILYVHQLYRITLDTRTNTDCDFLHTLRYHGNLQ